MGFQHLHGIKWEDDCEYDGMRNGVCGHINLCMSDGNEMDLAQDEDMGGFMNISMDKFPTSRCKINERRRCYTTCISPPLYWTSYVISHNSQPSNSSDEAS